MLAVRGNGKTDIGLKWLSPLQKLTDCPPPYTKSLDAAFKLSRMLVGNERGGVGWEPGSANAVIGNDGYACRSTEPAIAICLSSLLRYAKLNLSKEM